MCTSACNSLHVWKHAHFLHEVVFVHMFMCTSVYVHVCVRECACVCVCVARACVNLPERTTKQICVNRHGYSQEHNKALSIRIILPHAHFGDFLFLFLLCACMYDVNIVYNFVYGCVHIMSVLWLPVHQVTGSRTRVNWPNYCCLDVVSGCDSLPSSCPQPLKYFRKWNEYNNGSCGYVTFLAWCVFKCTG